MYAFDIDFLGGNCKINSQEHSLKQKIIKKDLCPTDWKYFFYAFVNFLKARRSWCDFKSSNIKCGQGLTFKIFFNLMKNYSHVEIDFVGWKCHFYFVFDELFRIESRLKIDIGDENVTFFFVFDEFFGIESRLEIDIGVWICHFFCRFDRKFGNESRLEIDIGGEICNFFFIVLTENLEMNHAFKSTLVEKYVTNQSRLEINIGGEICHFFLPFWQKLWKSITPWDRHWWRNM